MKTFRDYFTEKRIEDEGVMDTLTNTMTPTSSFMDYRIRKPTSQITTKHIWLDIIRTRDEANKRKGGATRLLNKLKEVARTKNLPIYLDPIGPKARKFFYNKGFQQVPFNSKLLYWDPTKEKAEVSSSPVPVQMKTSTTPLMGVDAV